MSEVKTLTETTNINNLTEQPAILEHVARLNDEIANLTAKCNTLKEKLDEAECAAINTELQNKIRDMFIEALGPNFKGDIDGAGSDAGPWEFTLSEISQGIGHLCEQRDEATRIVWESVAAWAQMCWDVEVKHRPEVNIYRTVLDTTWKQVINKAKETIGINAVIKADSKNWEHCGCIPFAECAYHADMRAERDTFKEQLEASEKSRHNLRLFANNETYFDLPMSGPDIDTRNRIFELRAEIHADKLRIQAHAECVEKCVEKVNQLVAERENLKAELATARADCVTLANEIKRMDDLLVNPHSNPTMYTHQAIAACAAIDDGRSPAVVEAMERANSVSQ